MKAYIANFTSYSIAKIIGLGAPFILLPLLTRVLPPSEYGVIALFNSFVSVVSIILSSGMAGAIARAYVDREDEGFGFSSYVYTAFVSYTILFLFVAAFLVLLSSFNVLQDSFLLFLAITYAYFSNFKESLLKLYVMRSDSFRFTVLSLLPLFTSMLVTLVFVYLEYEFWEIRVVPIVLVELVAGVCVVVVLQKMKYILCICSGKYFKDLVKFVMPLLPHSVGLMLLGVVDKLMVSSTLGADSLGIYGVAFSLASLLMVAVIPLDQTLTPLIFRLFKDPVYTNIKKYKKLFLVYIVFITLASGCLYFLIIYFGPWFVGSEYISSLELVLPLLLGQMCFGFYRYFVKLIFYKKITIWVSFSTMLGGVVSLLLLYYLIPLYGLYGVAVASSSGYLVTLISVVIISTKLLRNLTSDSSYLV